MSISLAQTRWECFKGMNFPRKRTKKKHKNTKHFSENGVLIFKFLFLPNPVIQRRELIMWDLGIFSTSSRICLSLWPPGVRLKTLVFNWEWEGERTDKESLTPWVWHEASFWRKKQNNIYKHLPRWFRCPSLLYSKLWPLFYSQPGSRTCCPEILWGRRLFSKGLLSRFLF